MYINSFQKIVIKGAGILLYRTVQWLNKLLKTFHVHIIIYYYNEQWLSNPVMKVIPYSTFLLGNFKMFV